MTNGQSHLKTQSAKIGNRQQKHEIGGQRSAKIPYGPREKVDVQVLVEFMFFMKPDLVRQS